MNAYNTSSGGGGPLVAVCRGPRCTALRQMTGTTDLDEVKAAIRATRGGVLVSCGCLGRCDLASVVLVGWRDAADRQPLSFAGMDATGRMKALADWLPGPGPADAVLHDGPLPQELSWAQWEASRKQAGRN